QPAASSREPDSAANQAAAYWNRLLAQTGGDFNRLGPSDAPPSFAPPALFLDVPGALALAAAGVGSAQQVLPAALAALRVVHFAPLDVRRDPGLRVMELITSLQRGGAER